MVKTQMPWLIFLAKKLNIGSTLMVSGLYLGMSIHRC